MVGWLGGLDKCLSLLDGLKYKGQEVRVKQEGFQKVNVYKSRNNHTVLG